jgi:hypothetical protein
MKILIALWVAVKPGAEILDLRCRRRKPQTWETRAVIQRVSRARVTVDGLVSADSSSTTS